MWQRLSLRSRINLLMALVLTLGLAINVARLVLEGGPRVQAEDQSVTRLAREFVETIVGGLNEAPNPEARLDQIVQDLKRLRHVSITWQTDAGAPADIHEGEEDDAGSVPGWFVTLVHPRTDIRQRTGFDPWQANGARHHLNPERRDRRNLGWGS